MIAKLVKALIDANNLSTLDVLIFCSLISHSLNLEASVVDFSPSVVTKYLTFYLAALKNNSFLPTPLMSRYRFSSSLTVSYTHLTLPTTVSV